MEPLGLASNLHCQILADISSQVMAAKPHGEGVIFGAFSPKVLSAKNQALKP